MICTLFIIRNFSNRIQMVEDLVREKQRFLEKARELRQKMKPIDVSAVEMIREDRDAK